MPMASQEKIEHVPFEQKEKFVPNLLTNYKHTVKAMSEIEGQAWLKQEERTQKHTESIKDAKEIEYETRNSLPGAMIFLKDASLVDDEGNEFMRYVIYGAYGMNRWFVSADSSVVFSKSHGTPQTEERARHLGFAIE